MPMYPKEKCLQCSKEAEVHVFAHETWFHFCSFKCLRDWLDVPKDVLDTLAGREKSHVNSNKSLAPAVGALAGAALLPYLIKKLGGK